MTTRDDKTPRDLNHYEPEDWFEGCPRRVTLEEYGEIQKWIRESTPDVEMEQERENW